MKYKVIVTFSDLQDCNHIYNKGDEYPRQGYSPSTERIDELLTDSNRVKKPLIQLTKVHTIAQEPKQVVQEVVEEPKRRGRRKKDDA